VVVDAKALGARVLVIPGEGEPLLDRRLKEIVVYAKKNGLETLIPTNGSLLTEEMANFLAKNGASLTISLDTLEEKLYDELTGIRGNFNQVMKNIETARRIFHSYIRVKGKYCVMPLSIHMTLSEQNFAEIEMFKTFCADDLFYSVGCIVPVREAEKHPELIKDASRLEAAARTVGETFTLTKTADGRDICAHLWYGLTLSAGGNLMTDAQAIETEVPLNIRNHSCGELLEISKKYKQILLERFCDGYCVIRAPRYKEFVAFLKTEFL